jgi:hypothetical protein
MPRFTVRSVATAICALALTVMPAACNGDDDPEPTPSATAETVPTRVPRLTLTGALTLDGAPFDAQFMGVRITRDGLATICQAEIPPVVQGAYEIGVLSDAEARGCGADGAELLLWTFLNDTFFYASTTTPWQDGGTEVFSAAFSTADPAGASLPSTGFRGSVTDADGAVPPAGTVIESYVGDVLCGVTSLRSGDFEGYSMIVAGPEAVAGCAEGATITFRIDGEQAAQTGVNDLSFDDDGHILDLVAP